MRFCMNQKAETLVHLGEYIQLLQRLVPVDGRMLTNEEVATLTGLSLSTYKRVKKGSRPASWLTMPCCGSTCRYASAVMNCPSISSFAGYTVAWRTITGPVVTDAVNTGQERCKPLLLSTRLDTLTRKKQTFIKNGNRVTMLMNLTMTLPRARKKVIYRGGRVSQNVII